MILVLSAVFMSTVALAETAISTSSKAQTVTVEIKAIQIIRHFEWDPAAANFVLRSTTLKGEVQPIVTAKGNIPLASPLLPMELPLKEKMTLTLNQPAAKGALLISVASDITDTSNTAALENRPPGAPHEVGLKLGLIPFQLNGPRDTWENFKRGHMITGQTADVDRAPAGPYAQNMAFASTDVQKSVKTLIEQKLIPVLEQTPGMVLDQLEEVEYLNFPKTALSMALQMNAKNAVGTLDLATWPVTVRVSVLMQQISSL